MTSDAHLPFELAEARRRLAELEAAEGERRRAEKVQTALYRIAELASTAQDMQQFYRAVHEVVGELMYAENLFIALYDEDRQLISWPYYVDAFDLDIPDPNQWDEFGSGNARGTTAYVLRTGEPQLLPFERMKELVAQGEVEFVGFTSEESTWVGVPLKSEGRTIGVLVVQSYTKDVRYTDADKELLAFVGQHVGAALSRARAIEETRRRSAELALINSVQEALAGELELQAIYDVVGDQLRDGFDAQVVDIGSYDEAAGLMRFPYTIERGVRFPDEPIPLIGFRRHVMESREPLVINEDMARESQRYGNPPVLSGEPAKSGIWMPLVAGGKATGVISVQNLDREHAFTEQDQRLLATLAGSLSVALENARLIHETRQRVAELATVNSVGQALAEQLDLDALIELVGERVRETFDADIAYVALHDEPSGRIDFAYYYESGKRRDEASLEFGQGLTSRIIDAGEPLVLNQSERYEEVASSTIGTPSRSYLGVPIVVGEKAIGVISVQSTREEGRFGDAEAGLLGTIAANVGVAIQNARLFEAQRDAERQYRELVEELPLAVYRDLPDETATSEYISPRVEAIFGYPREAWMAPEFFASVLHPEDRDRTIAELAAALAGGDDRWSLEYRVIAADGRTVSVRDDAWIVKDEQGTPTHVQGFMIDVTDQAIAHAEIRRQKQYFESLVEISPVAVVVMDTDERVTGWNPAAANLFGYSPEEAIGRSIDDLVLRDELRSEGRDVTREALEGGRSHRIARRARKDGGLVDVEMMLVPLSVDGERVGFYAIYHDITELQRARQEAEAATQAKGAFLAAMSHEIRTPMNAVIGMTDLLLGTELAPEQRDYAEVVRSSGDALLHVIDDILDYSKIEAGKLELERAPFDLRGCVEEALDIVAPRASAKEIEVGCLIDEEAPAGIVGDSARLRQVLLNLLSNAVKFTEEGEVVVHVDAEPTGAGSYRLQIAVRDTGIGIPEDRMDRLFASFSQVDASTTRRYGGTGLGLAISKRLIELMGGALSVESEPGKGSTFQIELSADEAKVAPRITEHGDLRRLGGKRILVVDDNATNREIVTRQVRAWGMQPVAVERPADALALIAAGEHFDVAVLDMLMPEMDGLSLAREIRHHRDERDLPLVLLTSLGRLPQARSAGEFAAQLVKPLKASQLYDALLGILAEQGEQPPVVEPRAPVAAVDGDKAEMSSLRILLAEDNPMNQHVALLLLERLGYRADVASNGLEALETLERQPYDVVLMDVQMPELDGLEASRRICERWPADARPRIIAMTANAMREDRDACFAAGMDDYVAKPIRPDELAEALRRSRPLRETREASGTDGGARLEAAPLESLRELGGDDLVAQVIDAFLADAPHVLATLRLSLEQGDVDELRRAAHTLKSNAATIGAADFSGLCRELEQRAKNGDLAGAAELASRLDAEYAGLQAAIAEFQAGAPS
jgi:PAS domain S-box-containing protein